MTNTMKRVSQMVFAVVSVVVLSGFIASATYHRLENQKANYKILPGSVLDITGKTNVNSFCCSSKEHFTQGKVSYAYTGNKNKIVFEKTLLRFNVDGLDCGMRAMNKDLKEALLSDQYPEIIIDIKEASSTSPQSSIDEEGGARFIAKTEVTITCETNLVEIPIQINKYEIGKYRIKGETALKLCDYAIDAPTAMLGLIKVEDEINISFDLLVDLE